MSPSIRSHLTHLCCLWQLLLRQTLGVESRQLSPVQILQSVEAVPHLNQIPCAWLNQS
jgi:hypothetical protein